MAISPQRIWRICLPFGIKLRQIDRRSGIAVIIDLARHDATRRAHHVQNSAGGHTFSTAAFTHHPQRFAALDLETHPIDGANGAFGEKETDMQVFDFQQ